MSKEDWENDLEWEEEEKTQKNNKQDDDEDDWENFDVDNLKDEEEEKKKKQAEEKKRVELEKENQEKERKKKELEKKRLKSGGVSSGTATKELSSMMQAYEAQSGDFDETLELFEGSQRPRIEILQPKDKKDFDEFADIVSDKLLESCSNEHYVYFLKALIEQCVNPVTADEMKEIQKLVNTLVTKKQVQEKEAKKLPQAAKKAPKRTVHVDDPFADLGGQSGGTAFDDDEDFM